MEIIFCLNALCIVGILSAADAVSDWSGRNNTPSNLSAGTEGLTIDGKELYVFSEKSYPVTPEGKYVLSGSFRRAEGNKAQLSLSFGLAMYDKDGNRLNGSDSCPLTDTQTLLLQAAKKGEKILKVKDALYWKKGVCAAFNAKEDLSDLPNRDISSGVVNIKKISDTEWEITLSQPLCKEYAAGTNVRQQSGPPYRYIPTRLLNDDWQTFKSPVMTGIGRQKSFRAGTASIRIVIFGTIGKPVGISMKDIEFKEIK